MTSAMSVAMSRSGGPRAGCFGYQLRGPQSFVGNGKRRNARLADHLFGTSDALTHLDLDLPGQLAFGNQLDELVHAQAEGFPAGSHDADLARRPVADKGLGHFAGDLDLSQGESLVQPSLDGSLDLFGRNACGFSTLALKNVARGGKNFGFRVVLRRQTARTSASQPVGQDNLRDRPAQSAGQDFCVLELRQAHGRHQLRQLRAEWIGAGWSG